MSGVFIPPGMRVTIPAGGLTLSVGDDGKLSGRSEIQVQYDLCPTWLELAARQLSDAEDRKHTRIAAWSTEDQDARATSMKEEFESSMLAIMAAAIAIDSFYASLRDKTAIPQDTIKAWKKNKTARYKQIAEVLRIGFSITQGEFDDLRHSLEEIFRIRDKAIHPSANVAALVLHPELGVGVEWRFVLFRADVAKPVVQSAQRIIHELVAKGKPSTPEIQRYIDGLRSLIAQRGVTEVEGSK